MLTLRRKTGELLASHPSQRARQEPGCLKPGRAHGPVLCSAPNTPCSIDRTYCRSALCLAFPPLSQIFSLPPSPIRPNRRYIPMIIPLRLGMLHRNAPRGSARDCRLSFFSFFRLNHGRDGRAPTHLSLECSSPRHLPSVGIALIDSASRWRASILDSVRSVVVN